MELRRYQKEDRELETLVGKLLLLLVDQQWLVQCRGNIQEVVLLCHKVEQPLQNYAPLMLTAQRKESGIMVGIAIQQEMEKREFFSLPLSPAILDYQKPLTEQLLSLFTQLFEGISRRQMDAVHIHLSPSVLQILREELQYVQKEPLPALVSSASAPVKEARESSTPATPRGLLGYQNLGVSSASAPVKEARESSTPATPQSLPGYQALGVSSAYPSSGAGVLPQEPPAPRVMPEDMIAPGILVFTTGQYVPLKGATLMLGRTNHEMRNGRPDINLANMPSATTVSRYHARIEHLGKIYLLTDVGSVNGTFVNGKKLVAHQPCFLDDGDVLEVGLVRCLFRTIGGQ